MRSWLTVLSLFLAWRAHGAEFYVDFDSHGGPGDVTRTTNDGTGSVVPVEGVSCFTAGLKTRAGEVLMPGDEIMVADSRARITGLDRSAHTLTLDWPLRWQKGDSVSYAYTGKGPDVGAFESGISGTSEQSGLVTPTVPLWARFETAVTNVCTYANPFTEVALRATFTQPDHSQVSFWGFHDGDGNGGQTGGVWKLRFMADQVGLWSYECSFSDGAPGKSGPFHCAADGAKPGPLRVDSANPRYWIFADGTRFLARAYSAPELFVAGNEQHWRHWRYWIDYFFGAKHRFNFCIANLLNFVGVGEELNWQGTPYKAPDPAQDGQFVTIRGHGLFPFVHSGPRPRFDGGSNVDWLRPSVHCWANVDKVLGELEVHRAVWFNHWGMMGWGWSGNGRLLVPPSARKPVLRYWIARLAPYWNITWNIAGERDELLTSAEFDELGSFIKNADPWKHPLTSHALGTTVDRPWVDFRVQQFAAGTSSDAVTNAHRAAADYANKPVFAFETSWEATPGKLTPDQVRTGAWGSLMGGAFYLYAECFEPTLTWGMAARFGSSRSCTSSLPSCRIAG